MTTDSQTARFETLWNADAEIVNFDWDNAVYNASPRRGELRWTAIGYIGARLYHVARTVWGGKRRIISLRKTNPREDRVYAEA